MKKPTIESHQERPMEVAIARRSPLYTSDILQRQTPSCNSILEYSGTMVPA
jgi:hypothetical protein